MKKYVSALVCFSILLLATTAYSAVSRPVFKWQKGGYRQVEFNKAMYTSPALIDLDMDGVAEVIWANFKVAAFDGATGNTIWSFWVGNDRNTSNTYMAIGTDTNIAVADINKDGFAEIVTAHTNGLVCAYDRNGNFLPGFPTKPMGRTDPVESLNIYDIDNDGYYEIIVGWGKANNLNIVILSFDGKIKPGWPQFVSNPNANALGIYGPNIAVGDINHDGYGELIVPSDTGKTCAYFYNGVTLPVNSVFNNNTRWPDVVNYENYVYEKIGWHVPDNSLDSQFYMGTDFPATIADVNGDGSYEIVIVGGVYNNPPNNTNYIYQAQYSKPFIYNVDRTRFNNGSYNWESDLPKSGSPLTNSWRAISLKRSNPVVVDIDSDGNKEILTSTYDGKVHCFRLDKTEHGRWPFSVYSQTEGTIRFASEPVVADLDNDSKVEIIFTSWPQYYSNKGGHLFIMDNWGNLLHKIALPYGDNGHVGSLNYDGGLASPSIGDIDGDGELEIVVGEVYAGLVVYDVPGAKVGKMPWPTGRHDYSRTGWTDYISNLDRVPSPAPWILLLSH